MVTDIQAYKKQLELEQETPMDMYKRDPIFTLGAAHFATKTKGVIKAYIENARTREVSDVLKKLKRDIDLLEAASQDTKIRLKSLETSN